MANVPHTIKSASQPEARISEANRITGDLQSSAERLQGIAKRLADRMVPITPQRPEQIKGDASCAPFNYSAPLFSDLGRSRESLETAMDYIASIIDDVEL